MPILILHGPLRVWESFRGFRAGRDGAEAEACDGGGQGVRRYLKGAEELGGCGGLIAEPEDEEAGLDLFGGKEIEAAGVFAELHLCGGGGREGGVGEGVGEGGVAGLVEGGEPVVEEVAGGGFGDEADLIAVAGEADEDEGVDGADVVSAAGGAGCVGGIAEDDGVDLGGIVVLVGGGGGGGGGGVAGATGGAMGGGGVGEGAEDEGERDNGGCDGEQDDSGAERLAGGEIEAGSGAGGGAAGRGWG